MDQLADLRVNLEMNLYFAPHIMSLIKVKTHFRGIYECEHKPFRPFKNDIAFLQRLLTPFPVVKGDASDNEVDDGNIGDAISKQCNLLHLLCSHSGCLQLVTFTHILQVCSKA